MKYLDKLKVLCAVLFLPMMTYGILGPLEIFAGNQQDFSFKISSFWGYMVLLSLFVYVIFACSLAFIPEAVLKYILGGITALGVASYVQTMFMNIKLSEADGSPLDFQSIGRFTYINAIVWCFIICLILGMSFVIKKHYIEMLCVIALFLGAIQLVATISLAFGTHTEEQNVYASGEKRYTVGSENNIIVFVLDTYGSRVYEAIEHSYPELNDGLNDFTYYDNADCHYYCTFPSMTHMLTGIEFDFEADNSVDWLCGAWQSDRATTFYNTIKEYDYKCNLYSPISTYTYGDIEFLNGKFDNIVAMEQEVDSYKLVKLMTKMSLFRGLPYILKSRFEVLTYEFAEVISYKEGIGISDDNAEFYKNLREQGLSIDDQVKNEIIVQYLFGLHKPNTIDENANYVEESDFPETVRGIHVILGEYLSQLKKLGVYDNSTIIITADHGSGGAKDPQPIFFLKMPKETHDEMQKNHAPISHDDFQATILSLIGANYEEYGTSIFEWQDGVEREREVFLRKNSDDYPEVEGSSWNIYKGYCYKTDYSELQQKIEDGPDEILPATPWIF